MSFRKQTKCPRLFQSAPLSWCSLRWLSIPIAVVGFMYVGEHLPYRLGLNTTTSEQTGVYLMDTREGVINRGDMVSFTYSYGKDMPGGNPFDKVTKARNGNLFIKRAIGMPGDRLYTKGLSYWLQTPQGDIIDLGDAIEKTPSGTSVPVRQKWNGYVIPRGEYFMSSTRVTKSFDSRYFGLVSESAIKGHDRLLFAIGDSKESSK